MVEHIGKTRIRGNFVTVAIAEDIEHAHDCRRLLKASEIDAIIKQNSNGSGLSGVQIIVARQFAEAAQAILAINNTDGDFPDMSVISSEEDDDEF